MKVRFVSVLFALMLVTGASAWGLPDLKIISFSAPSSASTGDMVEVSYSEKNVGDMYANNYATSIYLSNDSKIDRYDTRLCQCGYGSSSPNSGVSQTLKVQIPAGKTGRMYIGILVDVYDRVSESVETNNYKSARIEIKQGDSATGNYQITVFTKVDGYTRDVDSISISGSSIRTRTYDYKGSTGAYYFKGLAKGTYTITASEEGCETVSQSVTLSGANGLVQLYLSSSSQTYKISGCVKKSGIPLCGVTVRAGAKEDDTDENGDYSITNLKSGDYTVRPESDEYDFTPSLKTLSVGPSRTLDFEATDKQPPPLDQYNIVPKALGPGKSVQPNETISLTWKVRNEGKKPTDRAFKVKAFLSSNRNKTITTNTAIDRPLFEAWANSVINVGEYDNGTSSVDLSPLSLTRGQDYYLKLQVDPDGRLAMDYTADNIGIFETITISQLTRMTKMYPDPVSGPWKIEADSFTGSSPEVASGKVVINDTFGVSGNLSIGSGVISGDCRIWLLECPLMDGAVDIYEGAFEFNLLNYIADNLPDECDLDIAGLKVEMNEMKFAFTPASMVANIDLTGPDNLPFPKFTIQELSISEDDGVKFEQGEVSIPDVKIASTGWGTRNVKILYVPAEELIRGSGGIATPAFELDIMLEIIRRKLNAISACYTPARPIPVFNTGVFIVFVELGVNNLANSKPVEFSGDVGFVAGPRFEIFGNKYSGLYGEIGGTIDTGGNFELHGCVIIFEKNKSGLGEVHGKIVVLLRRKTTVDGILDVFKLGRDENGIFHGDGNLTADANGNFSGNVHGVVSLPDTVWITRMINKYLNNPKLTASVYLENRVITGTAEIRSFTLTVIFDPSQSGWDRVSFDADLSIWDLISMSRADARKLNGKILSTSMDIPAGAEKAIIRLVHEQGVADFDITSPDGHLFTAETYPLSATNESDVFYLAGDDVWVHDATQSVAMYAIAQPTPGLWSVDIHNAFELGAHKLELLGTFPPASIELTAPETDLDNPSTVNIEWEDGNPSDAEVSLFYDTDKEGYDGILITCSNIPDASGLREPLPIDASDPANAFIWDTSGVASGVYYIYAMIKEPSRTPRFDYADAKIDIIDPLGPDAPENVKWTVGDAAVDLKWDDPTSPETGFRIFWDRNIDAIEYENFIGAGTETYFTLGDLTNGRKYKIGVQAYDNDGRTSKIVGPYVVELLAKTGNNAPSIQSSPETDGRVGYLYEYDVEAFDPDGDKIGFFLKEAPDGMLIEQDTGLVKWTPDADDVGLHPVTVQVKDVNGATDEQDYILTVTDFLTINHPPHISSLPLDSAEVGQLYEYSILASDPDGNGLSFRLATAPAGMSLATGSNRITWVPMREDFPTQDVEVVASDGIGGATTQAFTINVTFPELVAGFDVSPETGPSPLRITARDTSTGYVDSVAWDLDEDETYETIGTPGGTVGATLINTAGDIISGNETREATLRVRVTGPSGTSASVVEEATRTVTVWPAKPVGNFTMNPRTGQTPLTVGLDASSSTGGIWTSKYEWTFPSGTVASATAGKTVTATLHSPGFRADLPITLTTTGPSGTHQTKKVVSIMPSKGLREIWSDDFNDGVDGWQPLTAADLNPEVASSNFVFSGTAGSLEIRNSADGIAMVHSENIYVGTKPFQISAQNVDTVTGAFDLMIRSASSEDYYRMESSREEAGCSELIVDLPGGVTMEFVLIPAGTFLMGSSDSWAQPIEQPVREETIEKDFYLAKYELTQAQWFAAYGSWPYQPPDPDIGLGDRYPAYWISWNDCKPFLTQINGLGLGRFRLPLEKEWEYACRAGSTTRFSFGDSDCEPDSDSPCELSDYAWWDGAEPTSGLHEVGLKLPNAWCLYDMHGNVGEFCQDLYDAGHRVYRGGNWGNTARRLTSFRKEGCLPEERFAGYMGVRLVLETGPYPWETKSPMPTARYGLCCAAVNGKIYAIGGSNSPSSGLRIVEEYDPSTDSWTRKTDMPTGRYDVDCGVVDGKIYVIGGFDGGRLGNVEEYDPLTDTWTTKSSLVPYRENHTCSVVDGKIYVIGGTDNGSSVLKRVDMYDPTTDTWTTKSDMITQRYLLTSAVVNDKIYVIGGESVEEYDPGTDTWTQKSNMLTQRSSLTCDVVNDKIYVIGGLSAGHELDTVEEYDPATDTWSTKSSMTVPRQCLSSAEVNGKIYAIGGWAAGPTYVDAVEEYNPGND